MILNSRTNSTLFAALTILDGTVIGRNMQQHRHQEFIRFLNTINANMPSDKAVHVILDNYAAHKHAKVREWLDRHPRFTFHFTPTSRSWLNAVEGFFAKLTKRRRQKRAPSVKISPLSCSPVQGVSATNSFLPQSAEIDRPGLHMDKVGGTASKRRLIML